MNSCRPIPSSGQGVSAAAAQAQLTPTRRRILDLLRDSPKALSAYELVDYYNAHHDKPIKPMSVYRSLAFLCEQGLVHHIHSYNRYVACCMPGGHRPNQYRIFYCNSCGKTHEQVMPEKLTCEHLREAEGLGLEVQGQYDEVRGVCSLCRE